MSVDLDRVMETEGEVRGADQGRIAVYMYIVYMYIVRCECGR